MLSALNQVSLLGICLVTETNSVGCYNQRASYDKKLIIIIINYS